MCHDNLSVYHGGLLSCLSMPVCSKVTPSHVPLLVDAMTDGLVTNQECEDKDEEKVE